MLKTDPDGGARPRYRRLPCSWQMLALDFLAAGHLRWRCRSRHFYCDGRDISLHRTRAQSGPSSYFHGKSAFAIQACPQIDPTTGPRSGLGSSYQASDPLACGLGSVAVRCFDLWVIYLLFTTFNGVFTGQYEFLAPVPAPPGLVYLGLGIALVLGVVVASNLSPRIQDARMQADGVGKPKPEYRLLPMIWLNPCVGLGLFIYGWTAYYKVRWVVPIIGTLLIGLGAYFVLVSSISLCYDS